MTKAEIIKSLRDQAKDKETLANGDADSIFAHDAQALLEAATLLKRLTASLAAAEADIAAMLWSHRECRFCKYAKRYDGGKRWTCKLGGAAVCRPEWKGEE